MNNLEFSPLYVARLSVNASYALNETTIILALPVKADLGPVCAAALDQLAAINLQLGGSINKNQKSALTEELKPLDAGRDADIRLIFRIDNAFLRSTDPALKAAASALQLFLSPYKGLADLPLDVQTRITKEMLGRYKASDELKAAAQKLNVADTFASLEEKNNRFAARYEARNQEYAAQTVSGSSLKPEANAAFLQFCTSLQQAANLMPNETVLALFNQVDELRKKYHAFEAKGPAAKDEPAGTTGA